MDKEELEKKKILSEIERNNAEAEKHLSDASHKTLPWYAPKSLLQALVAGAVVAGLLAAWVIAYLQPILTANKELGKIERDD